MTATRRSHSAGVRASAGVVLLLCFTILAGAGLAPAVAQSDTTPPVFQSLSASPGTVAPGESVTVTARITDAGTGVENAVVVYRSPDGTAPAFAGLGLVSGTAQDGIYEGTLRVPPSAPGGTWTVSAATATDFAGNRISVADPTPPTPDARFTVAGGGATATPTSPSTATPMSTSTPTPTSGIMVTSTPTPTVVSMPSTTPMIGPTIQAFATSTATRTPTMTVSTPTATATPTATPTMVSTAVDDDDDVRLTTMQREQRRRTNQAGRDDYRTEGNVVGVRRTIADPVPDVVTGPVSFDVEDVPYALIVTRDGLQQVRLIGASAAAAGTSIRVGDYLEAEGTKQHEFLFDADDVTVSSVSRR